MRRYALLRLLLQATFHVCSRIGHMQAAGEEAADSVCRWLSPLVPTFDGSDRVPVPVRRRHNRRAYSPGERLAVPLPLPGGARCTSVHGLDELRSSDQDEPV